MQEQEKMMDGMRRREFVRRAGAMGIIASSSGLIAAACGSDDSGAADPADLEGEVNVIAWAQEFEFALDDFQRETGVKVNMTFQTGEAESLQTVRSSPGTFDVVDFGTAFPGYTDLNLLRELDPDELEHWEDLPEYLQEDVLTRFGGIYQIPYYWGATVLGRNTEVVPEEITTWDALWDPEYEGRIAFLDLAEEARDHIAFYAGIDLSDFSDDAFATLREAALELIPNVRTFWSTGADVQKFLGSGEVGLTNIWDGNIRVLIKNERPVEATLPSNGVRGWISGPGILNDAPHPNAALAFVNYMTQPEVGAELGREYAYTAANLKSFDLLDEETNTLLQADQIEEIFTSGIFYVPTYTPEDIQKINRWWTDIKASA